MVHAMLWLTALFSLFAIFAIPVDAHLAREETRKLRDDAVGVHDVALDFTGETLVPEVEVTLTLAAIVVGTVVDPQGVPLPEARIATFLADEDGAPVATPRVHGAAGPDGDVGQVQGGSAAMRSLRIGLPAIPVLPSLDGLFE